MIDISKYSSKIFFPKNEKGLLFLINSGSIRYAEEILKNNKIEKIYYKTDVLKKYLSQNSNFRKINQIKISDNIFFSFFHLIIVFMKSKIKKRKIFFFHESSFVEFDILVNLMKINGYHYLTSVVEEMSWNKKIDNFFMLKSISLSKKLFYTILKFFFEDINYYHRVKQNNNLPIFSFQNYYHKNIEKFFFPLQNEITQIKSNKILFLVSIDLFNENNSFKQKKIFEELISSLNKLGFNCYVKDHPNLNSQLKISKENTIILDYYEPAELSNLDFHWVIGATSASLFSYKNSISIIKLYMNNNDLHEIKKFFNKSKANHIKIPENKNEIIQLINN